MAGPAPGLVLPSAVCDAMVQHCLEQRPKEACGFLIADAAGRVHRAQRMRNVEESPIGYSMDPREQLQVEKQLRSAGERVVAIYHSHTASAAYPSSVDVGHAISPDISYVLVSTVNPAQPVVKSYRIDGDRVTEEPIR
jgi:proteasome lid subunit RPN8/RPN11